jgi:CHAT domain-containing protein
VVTRRGVAFHRIPGRERLRTRVELMRRGMADAQRAESRATLGAAHALWRMLIEPALPALAKAKRLVISPDGPLALVPFEALLATEPREGTAPAARDWLVSRWAVSTTFSAAALAARTATPAGSGIVALADAEFGGHLPRLPETARELEALGRHAGTRPFTGLSGAGATRAALLGSGLERAGVIHIATHGEANPDEPLRSGLWTSPAPGDSAPGFVSLADVSALRLDAALVTLSACETGLGRLERGEGVVGLTRGFLAAGARSVVVSLWQVNDIASARLMERFYAGLLESRATRAEALARAKRELLGDPETRAPFYWAPFVLVGESGPIE